MSDTICKEVFDESVKTIETQMNALNKNSKKPLSKNTQKETLKKVMKYMKSAKAYKNFVNTCKKTYYNKGCVGTLFESGKNNDEFVKESLKKSGMKEDDKAYKFSYDILLAVRKDIFKNKKNVLKDDFYEKLTNDDVKLLKSKGAISGCVAVNPFNKTAVKKLITKQTKKIINTIPNSNATKKNKKMN